MIPATFDDVDVKFMQRALVLAQKGRYTTMPNPAVGCVIVRDGQVLGEGWHEKAGCAHAEVNAIRAAGGESAIAGATVYVTLEPCNNHGRTPPCVEALIRSKVARVCIAMLDPNPLTAGQSADKLRALGIAVSVGILADEARLLNRGFLSRMERQRPFVLLKSAMSVDGRTAMASGESKWITGEPARRDVQRLRALSCAMITGIETVLADNPSLTVRHEMLEGELSDTSGRQPLRVIVDSALRIPDDAKILHEAGEAMVVCGALNAALQQKADRLVAAGVSVVSLPDAHGRVDLPALLALLARREVNQVMVEAGATLSAAFVEQHLVDEWVVYVAPTLLGASARPLINLSLETMNQQRRLKIDSQQAVGSDIKWVIHF